MKKAKSNADAYEAVLAHFYVDGKRHGTKTKLGLALGKSRQVVDRWQRHGIPHKYSRDLQKITGLKFADIWPEDA